MTMTAKELREATLRGEGPLAKAHDDEPVFLLRGQDNLAAELVGKWATLASVMVPSIDFESKRAKKVAEARQISDAMAVWPNRKDPD
jgi:hypothetical protein